MEDATTQETAKTQRPAPVRLIGSLAITALVVVAIGFLWAAVFDVVGNKAAVALYLVLPWLLMFAFLRNSRLWVRIVMSFTGIVTTFLFLIIIVGIALRSTTFAPVG